MCFSPEADLVAGVVVTALGVDALRHARRRELVPLAALPVVLGVHQLIETLVWWNLRGGVSGFIGRPAAWIYVVIAVCVVPVLVPYAFSQMGATRRRSVARVLVLCGLVSAMLLTVGLASGSMHASVEGHHIAYHLYTPWQPFTLGLYIVATCAPGLLSDAPALRVFGVTNLLVVAALIWLAESAVVSLWCVWAAVSSALIDLYVRRSCAPVTRPSPSHRVGW